RALAKREQTGLTGFSGQSFLKPRPRSLRVEILVVVLTRSSPPARPGAFPIYVARFPPAPFALGRELHILASSFRILEDFAFVIPNHDFFVVVEEDIAG